MRILFDSKKEIHKSPFGTLTPGQICSLHIHIPTRLDAVVVSCQILREDGSPYDAFPLCREDTLGEYTVFGGSFSLSLPGLYFYFFQVEEKNNRFRLYRVGNDTNMEAGELWQVSCIPEDFTTPDWAKGATIYQVFPDRFCKSGFCDLTGKLEPYTFHSHWREEVFWQPTEDGKVLNNDFYGGNFRGITEKMDYIASMGTTILYLNPISKSFSSHRYDTGDYKTPDPMLGTMEDFSAMCRAAHERNIRVILDGVYSHTGDNSLYFDKKGTFGNQGAYASADSPYYSWYQFKNYPEEYLSWWGFDTLPTVNKNSPDFIRYIITDEDSVVKHWLNAGADGFRLDVVDELPDAFVALLKKEIRKTKPDALLIGEVWEDASNKIAYGVRRRYFVDGVLDSCMNYPFRTGIINFVKGADGGNGLKDTVLTILENYPPQVACCNMNLLGSHDTPRILTALVDDFSGSREELAKRKLSKADRILGVKRLKAASFLQYSLPGSPSLYYGDEAGMEGGKDPFNRRTYPWGQEDAGLIDHYRKLGAARRENPAMALGDLTFFQADEGKIGFVRQKDGETLRFYVNCSGEDWVCAGKHLLLGEGITNLPDNRYILAPYGFCITEDI